MSLPFLVGLGTCSADPAGTKFHVNSEFKEVGQRLVMRRIPERGIEFKDRIQALLDRKSVV